MRSAPVRRGALLLVQERRAEGSSITEGIGQSRITKNLEGAPVDDAYRIADAEAVEVVFGLLREEGLFIGGSSGINVAGAIRLARDLGPGHTIVTVLTDGGQRYASRLFNPEFLRSKNLPVAECSSGGMRCRWLRRWCSGLGRFEWKVGNPLHG